MHFKHEMIGILNRFGLFELALSNLYIVNALSFFRTKSYVAVRLYNINRKDPSIAKLL